MAKRDKHISKELDDELRSISFSNLKEKIIEEEIASQEAVIEEPVEPQIKPTFSLNKRVVTLEYLDKLEKATIASARYDAFQEFSQIITNLSLILLSVSIISYFVFYFINPDSSSLMSLLLLSLEAFALLGLTFFSMTKASSYKQMRDMATSDLSTVSQAIGNPRADAYIPSDSPSSSEL